jgi:hypothetical protein
MLVPYSINIFVTVRKMSSNREKVCPNLQVTIFDAYLALVAPVTTTPYAPKCVTWYTGAGTTRYSE